MSFLNIGERVQPRVIYTDLDTLSAIPAMRANRFGRIINIASAHGLVASPFKAAYVAAKHDITCNAICPGYVYTPPVEAQIDGQAKAHGISREQVIHDVLLVPRATKPSPRLSLRPVACRLCLSRYSSTASISFGERSCRGCIRGITQNTRKLVKNRTINSSGQDLEKPGHGGGFHRSRFRLNNPWST
jgi:hypothetical protein